MLESLRTVYDYELWALRRLLSTIERYPPDETTSSTFSHILNAYQIWHDRMDGVADGVGPWDERSLDESSAMLDALGLRYRETLDGLSKEGLLREFTYSTTEGTRHTNTIGDILLHLSLHSAYHRGQINREIRLSGCEPVVLDYVMFVRERR